MVDERSKRITFAKEELTHKSKQEELRDSLSKRFEYSIVY